MVLAHMAAPIPDTLSYENACCTAPDAVHRRLWPLSERPPRARSTLRAIPNPPERRFSSGEAQRALAAMPSSSPSASGYEVITTASPRNFDYVKKLGASQVFDYNKKDVVKDIIEAFKGKTCAGALAIATGSAEPCSAIVDRLQGNKFVSVASPPVSLGSTLLSHPSSRTCDCSLLLLRFVWESIVDTGEVSDEAHSHKVHLRQHPDAYNEVSKVVYQDFLPQALANGRYVAAPEPVVVGSGIGHIQAGLDAQRQGVSAKKVVVSL